MGVCKVSVHLSVYLSVQALYGTANALYWKSFVRQNSTHLTLLKYQNTKTYISSIKIIGFLHFLKFLGPSEKKLLLTVFLDHPVFV